MNYELMPRFEIVFGKLVRFLRRWHITKLDEWLLIDTSNK